MLHIQSEFDPFEDASFEQGDLLLYFIEGQEFLAQTSTGLRREFFDRHLQPRSPSAGEDVTAIRSVECAFGESGVDAVFQGGPALLTAVRV
jgi:hypothetical protein